VFIFLTLWLFLLGSDIINYRISKTKGKDMKQAINIRLDKEMLESLDEYAAELDKSRTSLIEKAIGLYFDTLDEMVSDKRIDNLKSGKTQAVSLEEVFKKAGISV